VIAAQAEIVWAGTGTGTMTGHGAVCEMKSSGSWRAQGGNAGLRAPQVTQFFWVCDEGPAVAPTVNLATPGVSAIAVGQ
jgi:hypothetical protein